MLPAVTVASPSLDTPWNNGTLRSRFSTRVAGLCAEALLLLVPPLKVPRLTAAILDFPWKRSLMAVLEVLHLASVPVVLVH